MLVSTLPLLLLLLVLMLVLVLVLVLVLAVVMQQGNLRHRSLSRASSLT